MILKDNSKYSSTSSNVEEFLKLQNIANRKISELLDEHGNNVFIYPHSLFECEDDTDTHNLFSLQTTLRGETCKKAILETGNIAGFISINGLSLSIHSRFSQDDNEDFFLHYMLEKELGVNIVNLQHSISNGTTFDFLVYLFPKFLNAALAQGLYKEYRKNEYNDSNLKGVIDINRHLRLNMPFHGKIAYNTREFCYDNHVTELIRHTIEYIGKTKLGKAILEKDAQMRSSVSIIVTATPKYSYRERERIINNNRRNVNHPYYSRYRALQKLCLKILRHEKLKNGENEDKINCILFDVAYLWEEYLATILVKHGFLHPNNKKGIGRIYLAKGRKFQRYPDYYRKNDGVIIDAKYKRAIDTRDDINQIITYLYRLKGKCGIFVQPTNSAFEEKHYNLLGYGEENAAKVQIFKYPIPQQINNYKEFNEEILKSELLLKALVKHVYSS